MFFLIEDENWFQNSDKTIQIRGSDRWELRFSIRHVAWLWQFIDAHKRAVPDRFTPGDATHRFLQMRLAAKDVAGVMIAADYLRGTQSLRVLNVLSQYLTESLPRSLDRHQIKDGEDLQWLRNNEEAIYRVRKR